MVPTNTAQVRDGEKDEKGHCQEAIHEEVSKAQTAGAAQEDASTTYVEEG
jgi:hypothetical protein